MNFKFKGARALRIDFNGEANEAEENSASIGFNDYFPEDRPTEFAIVFDIELTSKDDYELFVKYAAYFEASEKLPEEFKTSAFPKVNAPAIAYPYLRAFISMVTMNAGVEPAVLPTLNFQGMYNEDKRREH